MDISPRNENFNLLVIQILEFILYIYLNKNWKIYWSEQSFTGLGPEERCSSSGLWDDMINDHQTFSDFGSQFTTWGQRLTRACIAHLIIILINWQINGLIWTRAYFCTNLNENDDYMQVHKYNMHQRSISWVLTVCLYSLLIIYIYISLQAFLLSLSKIPLWCQAIL